MDRRLPKSMSSVVPVSMAMEPSYVVHEAISEASPEFWMVVVAPLPHWAEGGVVSGGDSECDDGDAAHQLRFLLRPLPAGHISRRPLRVWWC